MLRLEHIRSGYGPVDVLHDISLEVQTGEVVALIGANGAGKTTCLNTIGGLVPLRGGRIRFMDMDLGRLPAHKIVAAGISMSPEGRRVFKRMSVRENLELGGFLARKQPSALHRRMEEVFELFPRLQERERQFAGTLSGGEQQMLAIGRALMADPKLLMLDEPSLGLAPAIVQEMFRLIDRIHAVGKTILLVEQNARMALAHAHRAYILQNGRLVMAGKAKDLLNDEGVRSAYLGVVRA